MKDLSKKYRYEELVRELEAELQTKWKLSGNELSNVKQMVGRLVTFFSVERTPAPEFGDYEFKEVYYHFLPWIEWNKHNEVEMKGSVSKGTHQLAHRKSPELCDSHFYLWVKRVLAHCVEVKDYNSQNFLNRVMYGFRERVDLHQIFKRLHEPLNFAYLCDLPLPDNQSFPPDVGTVVSPDEIDGSEGNVSSTP